MNTSLLDPFQSTDIPEIIEEFLDNGVARCIAFNRRGSILAAGCNNGTVVLWDFDTRGVTRKWEGAHTDAVASVSWTKSGEYLLTSSLDCSVVLWDVVKGEAVYKATLPTAVLSSKIHPYNGKVAIAAPIGASPKLIEFDGEIPTQKTLPIMASVDSEQSSGKASSVGDGSAETASMAFSRKGEVIFVGSVRGTVTVVDTGSLAVLQAIKVGAGSPVKAIFTSRKGTELLVISADRILRTYNTAIPEGGAGGAREAGGEGAPRLLTMTKEFQNVVNRLQWRSAGFSPDSEFVMGGSNNKAEHSIHIWNRTYGTLEKILEGPPEGIFELAWHPNQPMIASVSITGKIYLWAKSYSENWSAFAPDFKELEENEEYVEREDEFDLLPEQPSKGQQGPQHDESADVDVEAVERMGPYSDSDITGEAVHFLATLPEEDDAVDSDARAPEPRSPPAAPDSLEGDGEGGDAEGGQEEAEDEIGARGSGRRKGLSVADIVPEGSKRRRITKVR